MGSRNLITGNIGVMAALTVLFLHSVGLGLWAVQGFIVGSQYERASQYQTVSISEARYRTHLGEKTDPSKDPDESRGFFSKLLPRGKQKEKPEKNGDKFFDRIAKKVKKRVSFDADPAPPPADKEKGSLPQLPNPWEAASDRFKGFQSMLSNIRSDEPTESDAILNAEKKRLEEIRKATLERRRQQQLQEQKRKEIEREKARAVREAERLAAERVRLAYIEKREKLLKQKEQMEQKRRIQAAAAAAAAAAKLQIGDVDTMKTEEPQKKSKKMKFMQGFMGSFERKEEWIVVGPKTMMSPGAYIPVTAGGLDLLVVASRDGRRLYCVANSCPHLGTPLETGILEQRPREPNRGKVSPPTSASSSSSPTLSLRTESPTEDCIVCPLHKTAFALASGEVRGEWCPYPPVIGPMTGAIKAESPLVTFDVRTRGRNIEVRISSFLGQDKE